MSMMRPHYCYVRVLPKITFNLYQPWVKSLYVLEFDDWGFKIFPSLVICAAWFLNDKVCSFHQGVHLCTLLTQKQSSKHSAEATAILSEGRTRFSTWPKNFSFTNTWHCYTWAAPCTQFSLLTGSTNFVTKFKQPETCAGHVSHKTHSYKHKA